MQKLNSLEQFKLKAGQVNFLLGIAGNGLSTSLQHEVFGKNPEGISYLNYVSLNDLSETSVLVSIANAIMRACGCVEDKLDPSDYSEIFGVFADFIALVQENKSKATPAMLIFDEFQKIKEFSNSFFFTLDKIFSINQIVPEFELTTVMISDSYLNPRSENPSEGIGKLFSHYPNFFVIPNYSQKQLSKTGFGKRLKLMSPRMRAKIYKLTAGIPSLVGVLIGEEKLPENPKLLLDDYEIEWKLHEIWESVGKDNQQILIDILIKKQFTPRNQLQFNYLTSSGLVARDKNEIVPKLFRTYVSKQINLDILDERRFIMINDEPLYLERLTPQEEKIALLLYDNAGKIVSREEIAKVLWGVHYLEKFSDYAIDKLISQLRTAMPKPFEGDKIIQTRRGKGYMMVL
ncbi:MAG: winged helix-turn-helix domain-containing protein [Candidatus Dojkabacteria bacterium]